MNSPILWTIQQVDQLAPDQRSIRSGQQLARPAKWFTLGRDQRALWGECFGSAAAPYQCSVDLAGPAFRCSCPSRKFPCKHALGLFYLSIRQPAALQSGSPPEWVADWLTRRGDPQAPPKSVKKPLDLEAQALRVVAREEKMLLGLEQLERFIFDLLRQGLADLPSRPRSFWANAAARMVDAQLSGVAGMLRGLATVPFSGEGWPERVLFQLARLYLFARAYRAQDELSDELRADVRRMAGWNTRQHALLELPSVSDRWQVRGQRIRDEEDYRLQRTWLYGENSGQYALILNYAFGGRPLESVAVSGTCFDAELVYHPSAVPLRAQIKSALPGLQTLSAMSGVADFDAALQRYSQALARNPWSYESPMALENVTPFVRDDNWWLADSSGQLVPISDEFQQGWELLGISGGRPLTCFGEWGPQRFMPLSVAVDGRYLHWTE